MMSNLHSSLVKSLQHDFTPADHINFTIASANYQAGLIQFLLLNKTGGDWDYKQQIAHLEGLPFPGGGYAPIPNDSYVYYFDIWTNFHYGYIGRAVGLSGDLLHAAADIPVDVNVGPVHLNNGQTDPGDILSEQIGIDLWDHYQSGLTRNDILAAIEVPNNRLAYQRSCKAVLPKDASHSRGSGTCVQNIIQVPEGVSGT